MKVEVKSKKGLRTILSVIVDKKNIQAKMDERLKELQKEVALKGFRPGKIPSNIVIREVGEDYILEESVDLYLPEKIFEILKSEEINPATRPVIKEMKKEKDSFKVDVLVTLWPTLSKLPKLDQTVEVECIAPTDEEINEQVDRVKMQFADVSKVERPAKKNDSRRK